MAVTRRNIIQMIPAAAAALSLSPRGLAANPHRVVVIGGGFAGCTGAKDLRRGGYGNIDVTLTRV